MEKKPESFISSIEQGKDGSATLRTATGGTMQVDKERNVTLDLETITAVGIRDLSEVETHRINRVMGSISHFVRFHGGGEVRFAYNHEGKLIELSAQNCGFSLSARNELLFHIAARKED
jgi:hypothetical protein